MADQDAPKSAYELAMARLRKKDQEEGVVDRPITDEQRAAIAEARKVGEARLAEREIMHQSRAFIQRTSPTRPGASRSASAACATSSAYPITSTTSPP